MTPMVVQFPLTCPRKLEQLVSVCGTARLAELMSAIMGEKLVKEKRQDAKAEGRAAKPILVRIKITTH